ncbi:MAG: AmmeMemoRadiSam system radical SAM enzyme, partial [Candidatus Neomarinimicrobiota bacterium]
MEIKEAKYYKTLNNEEVVCTLCPRVCKLKPGELGFCRVRKN